jgi:hypothetical protein
MAIFRVGEKDGKELFVKEIDSANHTLSFTENRHEAMKKDDGFYADAERDFLKFHFSEQYPNEIGQLTVIREY